MNEILNTIKIPPNSLEAEQAVIGALLIGAPFEMITASLTADDFYHRQHKIMFTACGLLAAKNTRIDLITMSELLSASNELNEVGGIAYIADLANNTPSASNAYAYAEIIKDRAIQRSIIVTAQAIVLNAWSESTTENKIAEAQRLVLSLGSDSKTDEVAQAQSLLPALIEAIEKRSNGESDAGINTGYPALDFYVKGFKSKKVYVLAGRPASGKTTLAINIAENLAEKNNPVLVFSLEMTTAELVERMVCSMGRLDSDAINNGKLDGKWDNLTRGVNRVKALPMYICDKTGLTIGRIRAIARFQKKAYGIKFIVIDHIGLIRTQGVQSRTIELGEVSRQIKEMAKELDVDVIELCQLNRGIEHRADKTPSMADLRDSGEIEQDADLIAFLYRPQFEESGLTDVSIAKNRGGKTGKFNLMLKGEFSRFESVSIDAAFVSRPQVKQSWSDKYSK